jgi:hypothetical protein
VAVRLLDSERLPLDVADAEALEEGVADGSCSTLADTVCSQMAAVGTPSVVGAVSNLWKKSEGGDAALNMFTGNRLPGGGRAAGRWAHTLRGRRWGRACGGVEQGVAPDDHQQVYVDIQAKCERQHLVPRQLCQLDEQ